MSVLRVEQDALEHPWLPGPPRGYAFQKSTKVEAAIHNPQTEAATLLATTSTTP